jgi:hypothetical protein
MGMRLEFAQHLVHLMTPEDQRTYGAGIHPPFAQDHHPAPKTDKLEREEQRQYANWLLLHGLKSFVWHKTNVPSTASLGTPDFVVPVGGVTLWIEFKRAGYGLSADQESFKAGLEEQGLRLYIVHTALEAIELTRYFMPLSSLDKPR